MRPAEALTLHLPESAESVASGSDAHRAMTALTLTPVNANVYSVHRPDGSHMGNLKRIGSLWKFKAIGYDAAGNMIPGGGPLTGRHNTVFSAPDAAEVSHQLG